MPTIGAIQAVSFALAPGPQPFNRKAWDNPIRYKLNRAYGDEFEYANYTDLTRRWKTHGTVSASDFQFPGGSSIDFKPAGQGSAIYIAAPSGDFEAVLEMSVPQNFTSMYGLAIVDVNGTGIGFSHDYDVSSYLWNVSSWNYSGTNNSVASGTPRDNRHIWIMLKKVGATYTGRQSIDGSTITATAAATPAAFTPAYLAIARMYTNAAIWTPLHRLNVYPGPTFFPG